jgi:archaellum component FlaF (FlaF/FlaG flagellin family)
VLDSSYGYNALSVAPYAARAKYYVLFADRLNIGDVTGFLSGKTVDKIIIYGRVDREVRTALARYNPEIIASENGSRFEENQMMVDKYSELAGISQVILTNGEFIEASMMSGKEPLLFIGRNNVPDEVQSYIKSKGIEIGVLIGNELIGSATTIRRQLGISVFVKFARGSRIPGGTINPVEDLDRFPMPSYQLNLSIVSISYNKATGVLEVTYTNNVDLATYFKSTITIRNANGTTMAVVGDQDVIFIDGGETKTVVYTVDLSEAERVGSLDNLTGEIYTIYGESKTSLENALRGTFKIETITVVDDTEIEMIDVVYDKGSGKFLITVENTGTSDAYVSLEIVDIWVNGEYVTVASDGVEKIAPGKRKVIAIKVDMADEDLQNEKNAKITVHAVYGARMHALVKSKYKDFELKFKEAFIWWYIPIILIIIILFILFFLRRRKRCPRCRTMNKRSAKHCKKCGHEFK